ncbi:MAG: hypothetical protein H6718_29715 [Polyangiaceae bacterium]|nr:hypothetical protein [Myxococcales bacterium]MCB9589629.1 hypothetical protein [Polyangiaceae bacterium]MCB9610326.1 hypothetical protein [Polyangiaceae bacterium]
MALSEHASEHFQRLAQDFEPVHLIRLKDEMSQQLVNFREAAKQHEMLPVDLAQELHDNLLALFALMAEFSVEQQALVVGAARYFVAQDDEYPDTETILGLDDDISVFNHVVEQLGRSDLRMHY